MFRGMHVVLAAAFLLSLMTPDASAGRKREKAGSLENGKFVDEDYHFSLTLRENWRARIGDGKDGYRVIVTQNDYDIPVDYRDAPSYTKIPRLVLYVDTTTLAPSQFIDSLLSRTFKSKQKTTIIKEFDILQENNTIQKGKRPVTVAGLNGSRWDANAKYVKEVQTSASSVGGARVNGSLTGTIVAVKKEKTIYLFHIMAETPFHESVMSQANEIISSLTFTTGVVENSTDAGGK